MKRITMAFAIDAPPGLCDERADRRLCRGKLIKLLYYHTGNVATIKKEIHRSVSNPPLEKYFLRRMKLIFGLFTRAMARASMHPRHANVALLTVA